MSPDTSSSPGIQLQGMLVSVPYLPHPEGDRPMDPEHPIYNESTRLQRLLEGLAAIPRIAPGSLRLAPSTAPHHSQPSSLGLGAEGQAADDCTAHYQVGHFGPES